MCSDFLTALPDWMDGPFTDIDAEGLAEDVDKWLRSTYKLTKVGKKQSADDLFG